LERLHQLTTTNRRHRRLTGGHFEAVVVKVNVVRWIALPDGQDHINGFGKQLVAVLVQDAQRFRVRRQGTRADAKNKTTFGQVVKHGRLRGNQGRVRMRQIAGARTQLDVLGFKNQRGQKQQAVGDVLGLVGQMLAHERVVKTQAVGINNGLPIFVQRFCSVPMQGMQGHGEVA